MKPNEHKLGHLSFLCQDADRGVLIVGMFQQDVITCILTVSIRNTDTDFEFL